MPLRPHLAALALGLLAVAACRKSDHHVPPRSPDIYTVGRKGTMATYWKGDSAITLSTTAGNSSEGTGIALVGTDVYVSGYQYAPGGPFIAMLWKNGIPTALTDGGSNAQALAVVTDGADVYVLGNEEKASGYYEAIYWKNGVRVRCSSGDEQITSFAIAVLAGDVYVTGERGRTGSGTDPINCYFKNGVQHNLGDSAWICGGPQGLTIRDNNIYAVWSETDGQGTYRTFYAKNFGTPVRLADGTANAAGNAIAFQGTDTYIAGWGYATDGKSLAATYWKNGVPVRLTDGPRPAIAMSLALDGSDVYSCGWTGGPAIRTATYWKNDQAKALTDSLTYGSLRQILVKR